VGAKGAEAPGAGILEEGAEVSGVVVEGVGTGRMRNNAFLKNSVISTEGQA
jgi:hypothetical protein